MLTYRILKRLADEDTAITNKKLSEELDSTPAKVRDKIAYLTKVMDKDVAEIIKTRGKGNGISLVVYDEERFRDFLDKQYQEGLDESRTMNHPAFRIESIVLKLLNSAGPIKSKDLAEELMISPRQLNNDLRVVKQILQEYSLRVVNRPHYGTSIEGTEFNKRLCLANLYLKSTAITGESIEKMAFEDTENANMITQIRSIVSEESARFGIQLSDIALNNLVIHLFVIIRRSSYLEDNGIEITDMNDKGKELTSAIIARIDREFSITLSEYDHRCLEIHITGKGAFLNDDIFLVPEETKSFTNDLLRLVDEVYKTQFQEDENLCMRLQLHFSAMFLRIKNNIVLKNALTNEIKLRYVLSYEIALLVGEQIEKRYHKKLAEGELASIALHFELSLYQTDPKKYKVLLVCHTERNNAEILKQRILRNFDIYIGELDTCAVNQIGHIDLDEYSVVFTTTPIQVFTSTPIYKIDDFLDDKDIQFIDKIFKRGNFSVDTIRKYFPKELFLGVISADTREDVISKMIAMIQKHRPIPDRFFENVMEREMRASTDYGNSIAIPHSSRMSDDGSTYTSVAILKKPIRWDKNVVRVVFLNNVSKGEEDLQYYYYLLSSFITYEEKVNALVQKPDHENLVWLLSER